MSTHLEMRQTISARPLTVYCTERDSRDKNPKDCGCFVWNKLTVTPKTDTLKVICSSALILVCFPMSRKLEVQQVIFKDCLKGINQLSVISDNMKYLP